LKVVRLVTAMLHPLQFKFIETNPT
jgi:hypothetical protein